MRILILATVLLLSPGIAQAQNALVFGSTDAQKCYQAAQLTGVLAESGLSACDDALIRTGPRGGLSRKAKASTLVNRGILSTYFTDFDAAFADFEEALRLVPGLPEAYVNRGNTYFFTRQIEMAVADYDESIKRKTRDLHAAHYNRGLANEARSEPELAFADFVRASELRPNWQLPASRVAEYRSRGYPDTD